MRQHELVIVGAGSGNSMVDESFADVDVAIVEHRRFGGTCLNVGCIPTKMLSDTADSAEQIRQAGARRQPASPRHCGTQLTARLLRALTEQVADPDADEP